MFGSLTTRSAIAAGAFLLVVAACGGDDSATTTSEAAAPATTQATLDATSAPDGRTVQSGDAVAVHYTGTLDNGEEFDSSIGGPTLNFTAGAGEMIAGFDAAVMGMTVGESKTIRITPDEAYGLRNDGLITEIGRDSVPDNVTVGQELVDGVGNVVVVVEVRDDVVVIDQNHPLAGEALNFEIELVSIN